MNRAGTQKRLPGVIDTLAAGLELVIRRPALLVIPSLLDLFYWLGPKLSVLPLAERLAAALVAPPGAAPEIVQAVEQSRETLWALGRASNLFSFLSPGLLGMPSLVIGQPDLASGHTSVIQVDNGLALLALGSLLTLLGLLIAAAFLVFVARDLRDGPSGSFAGDVVAVWLRFILLVAILILSAFVFGFPVSVMLGLASLFSPAAVSFLLTVVFVLLVWLSLYLFFTVDAIVLQCVTPVRAMWYSANVVRHNFWASLALIVVVNVLNAGLGLVWARISALPGGEFLGIVANSLVGVALIAAGLIFYRDRFERWDASRRANVSSTTALQ